MTGRILCVTGTSTGVGKTIVTAALAASACARGQTVAVVKPVQTGAAVGDSDAAEIRRLTGIQTETFTVLDEPLAPDTAARRAGITIPTVADHAARIRTIAESQDLVLVEGVGGILVRLDTNGGTLLDLAAHLRDDHLRGDRLEPTQAVSFMVVTAAGLGTLNHTELTVRVLQQRGFDTEGLIIGSWKTAGPGLAELCNRADLSRVTGLPLLGALPEAASSLSRADFTEAAQTWMNASPATRAGCR